MKSFSEISVDRLIKYSKSAKKDIDKNRNTVKTALDQPASPMKAKAGMDAMSKLHKRSKGSDMYVNKMTGRSKVKPTASDAEYHKTLANTKNSDQGIEALKKKHGMSHDKATKTLDRLSGMSEAAINELDKKTLGSYIKKAGPDAVKQTAQAKRHSDAGDMADKDRDMYKAYGKSQRAMDKAKNRQKGISKAVDKLTREATIPDGQLARIRKILGVAND